MTRRHWGGSIAVLADAQAVHSQRSTVHSNHTIGRGLWSVVCGLSASLLLFVAAWAAEPPRIDHGPWDQLLRRSVREGLVDYDGFKRDRRALDQYLAMLQQSPATLSREGQLAFWINGYNATVVAEVLDHEPVQSVKDIRGFFTGTRHRLGGESLTLNQIEAKARDFGDWRVHVALVCASTSCPLLRSEAYAPERLIEQLADQARRFLSNPQWGQRVEGGSWRVSKIVQWYAGDFVHGALTVESLVETLAPYLEAPEVARIREQARTLKFLDYDWSLNRQPKRHHLAQEPDGWS